MSPRTQLRTITLLVLSLATSWQMLDAATRTFIAADSSTQPLIEVTRDKKVVWKFQDFKRFGNSLTNSRILSVDGTLIK